MFCYFPFCHIIFFFIFLYFIYLLLIYFFKCLTEGGPGHSDLCIHLSKFFREVLCSHSFPIETIVWSEEAKVFAAIPLYMSTSLFKCMMRFCDIVFIKSFKIPFLNNIYQSSKYG